MNDLPILDLYQEAFPTSRKLFQRAADVFLDGVTHVGRVFDPFPLYIVRAKGGRKWDVDGNEYVDYWGGHGSLLLGHQRPEVVEALQRQIAAGIHYGGCHELEIEWAELVTRLIPSAEKVRFVCSGTEATLMGIRLARAYTGKSKIISMRHFHGWHDNVIAVDNPAGILKGVIDSIVTPGNDIAAIQKVMEEDDDIACVILCPPPSDGDFLRALRRITGERGVVLIFDEVVSGFRITPGGVQALHNVIPDLTALAKVLTGGLPGGAICGRSDIMELLEIKADEVWSQTKKIPHSSTFSAHPLSAATGVAALKLISTGEENKKANAVAQALREAFGEVIARHGVNWSAGGDFSNFGVGIPNSTPEIVTQFRRAIRLNGVDLSGPGGMTSSAHTPEDVEKTAGALDATIELLKKEKLVST